MTDLVIEPLARSHDRAGFCCGVEPLDRYLREQAGQDVKRRATACFVARESSGARILGYYTLSAGGVALSDLPEALARRLPRYPSVPVTRLGRLAVDREFRGQKLGAVLLWDAGSRSLRSELVAFAMVVDAKDDSAEAFYRHFGFVPLGQASSQLVLPLSTFAGA